MRPCAQRNAGLTQQRDELSLQERRVKAAYDINYLKQFSHLNFMRLPWLAVRFLPFGN